MKIVQVENHKLHWITPYKTWDEVPEFAPDIILVEAPDEAQEGWDYNEATGAFTEPAVQPETPTQPTNQQLSQQLSALQADILIAGTIPLHSPNEWHDRYMADTVTSDTLQRLTSAGLVEQSLLNNWADEHEERYGYR